MRSLITIGALGGFYGRWVDGVLGRVTEFLAEVVGAPFSGEVSVALRAARQDARFNDSGPTLNGFA